LTTAGRSTIVAKFTRGARKTLGSRRTVKVLVRLTVTDRTGRKSVQAKRVTLRR
jgi:hypothetical protein